MAAQKRRQNKLAIVVPATPLLRSALMKRLFLFLLVVEFAGAIFAGDFRGAIATDDPC
jgi:hypothetical protein